MQFVTTLDFAGGQPRQRGIALVHRRRAVDVFGADAGGDELVSDMDRMPDAGGKADGFLPLAEFDPVGDDVADQFRPVHAIGEFALDVIAVPDVNTMQIRIDRRIDAGRDQIAPARRARRPAGIGSWSGRRCRGRGRRHGMAWQ